MQMGTTQNNVNSGEEQLIAFGEATVEDVGMGTEKNSRTVTFELSQVPENRGLSTTSQPPLISSDKCIEIRHFLTNRSAKRA